MSNNFKEDNVYKLSDREKSREKIDMFFGDRSNFYHPAIEKINNGIDEVLNNFESGTVTIILHDDLETMTIHDTGRGIPIDTYEKAKDLLECLFVGGKYDITDNTTTGTFGCGLTASNYNSELFQCISYFNGKTYQITYTDGGYTKEGLVCLGDTSEHGTKITFKLDKTSFSNTTYNSKEVELIIRRFSQVSEKIKLIYIHNGETKEFNHTKDSYFDTYAKDTLGTPMYSNKKNYTRKVEVERKGEMVEVDEVLDIDAVLVSTTSEEPLQETMLNGNYLREHGSIYDGIVDGVKFYINKYCKDNNLYKKNEKNINNNDVISAISFTCRVFNNLPSFGNQTKFYTKKEYYKQIAKEYIQEQLEVYKLENEKDFKRLVDQVLICKRANDVNLKSRQELKKKLTEKVDNINNRIDGLYECKDRTGKKRFGICEGKSALSSLIFARPNDLAIMCIRGKMTNALKSTEEKILSDNIIINILRAYGVKIDEKNKKKKNIKFDISDARYDEIDIITDADIDGIGSIAPLLLTMFNALIPQAIEDGIIHIVMTPLYEVQDIKNDKMYYAIDDEELKVILDELKDAKYRVGYVKGLAECTKDGMKMCLKDDYKNKIQVRADNYEEVLRVLELHMGKQVKPRYDYIIEHFEDVDLIE